ncbi:MAG: thiamine phosphate synthase [Candidatus Poribacteria bacterium]|nr:thiamine phosphate synthase [Candidatus Poribacteria bacterium]
MTNKKRPPIDFKLYAITDRWICEPRPLYDVIRELLDVGVTAIQLREKDLGDLEFYSLAAPIAELCHTYSARLFVNSRVKIALELEVAGLHFPANAPGGERIKTQAGKNLLIGGSIHSLSEALAREKDGVDFVTYSPIFTTASKPGYGPAVGLKGLNTLASAIDTPIFALGGVSPDHVSECMEAGAYGVAAMSSLMLPETGGTQAREYLTELERYNS